MRDDWPKVRVPRDPNERVVAALAYALAFRDDHPTSEVSHSALIAFFTCVLQACAANAVEKSQIDRYRGILHRIARELRAAESDLTFEIVHELKSGEEYP
jgi:hypothetical protein